MSPQTTDRIEKAMLLRAPRSRVWRALADSREFGEWFGVNLASGLFKQGARISGPMSGGCGHDDVLFEATIEVMQPESRFAYRWHPFAIEKGVDYSGEPTTLVEFTLEEVAGGTKLSIVESGFDSLPLARRAKALEANDGGWTQQAVRLEKYLATHA